MIQFFPIIPAFIQVNNVTSNELKLIDITTKNLEVLTNRFLKYLLVFFGKSYCDINISLILIHFNADVSKRTYKVFVSNSLRLIFFIIMLTLSERLSERFDNERAIKHALSIECNL